MNVSQYKNDQLIAANIAAGAAGGLTFVVLATVLDPRWTLIFYRAPDLFSTITHGFTLTCMQSAVYRGAFFGLYDSFRPWVRSQYPNDPIWTRFVLGWSVCYVAGFLSAPFGAILNTRIQTKTNGVRSAISISQTSGIRGYWQRIGTGSIFRSVAGGTAIALYDLIQQKYQNPYYL